jgi:hypothetical protein
MFISWSSSIRKTDLNHAYALNVFAAAAQVDTGAKTSREHQVVHCKENREQPLFKGYLGIGIGFYLIAELFTPPPLHLSFSRPIQNSPFFVFSGY